MLPRLATYYTFVTIFKKIQTFFFERTCIINGIQRNSLKTCESITTTEHTWMCPSNLPAFTLTSEVPLVDVIPEVSSGLDRMENKH